MADAGRRVPRAAPRRRRRDRRGADGALPRGRGARRRGGRARAQGRGHARRALPGRLRRRRRRTSARPRCSTCSSRASPRRRRRRPTIDVDGAGTAAFVFKTVADPFAGRINVFRVLAGTLAPTRRSSTRARTQGAHRPAAAPPGQGAQPADEFGAGDIGAVAKLKDVDDRRPAARRRARRSSRRRSTSPSR